MKDTIIGIDCGIKTGLAIWSRGRGFEFVTTTDFWEAHDLVLGQSAKHVIVAIEAPYLNSPIYHGGFRKGIQDEIARRVGSNHREASLLVQRFRSKNYEVHEYKPEVKKWDRKTVEQLTGYKGQSSEHTRDAIRALWHFKHLLLRKG